jgi:spore maturation protein CgeB
VLYKLSKDKPKLIIFSKCNGIPSNIIAKCSLNCKTWLWFMDGINTLNTVPEIIEHANMADYVSCTGVGVAQHIKKQIGAEVHHIMEGIDPETYRPTVSLAGCEADISFIGSANQERIAYLKFLQDAGITTKAYGNGFAQEVHGSLFNVVCSSSKAMLALSAEYDTYGYFSDRVLRLGACGAFVFHKYATGMEKFFVDGQDLVYFGTPELLLEAINHYMVPEMDNARIQMANSLRQKVLERHTWLHTAQKILDIAEI